jgi:hypothetical protein
MSKFDRSRFKTNCNNSKATNYLSEIEIELMYSFFRLATETSSYNLTVVNILKSQSDSIVDCIKPFNVESILAKHITKKLNIKMQYQRFFIALIERELSENLHRRKIDYEIFSIYMQEAFSDSQELAEDFVHKTD